MLKRKIQSLIVAGIGMIILITYHLNCTYVFSPGKRVMGLLPFGYVDPVFMDSISRVVEKNFGYRVNILPAQNLPAKAFISVKVPRYRADSLLKFMSKFRPDSLDFILAITDKDISTTKRLKDGRIQQPEQRYSDWGVMGLGLMPGHCCIISTYRIKSSNKYNFYERLEKISIHELGHNLGLAHCPDPDCVMRDAAETIKTIDLVKLGFCNSCLKKIQ